MVSVARRSWDAARTALLPARHSSSQPLGNSIVTALQSGGKLSSLTVQTTPSMKHSNSFPNSFQIPSVDSSISLLYTVKNRLLLPRISFHALLTIPFHTLPNPPTRNWKTHFPHLDHFKSISTKISNAAADCDKNYHGLYSLSNHASDMTFMKFQGKKGRTRKLVMIKPSPHTQWILYEVETCECSSFFPNIAHMHS